ncbi:hypothetical protein B0H16DRAFT_1778977 [Mycena metata]|uniref:Prefoldin subunit 5 n=1 Tax=Mycena metata TaxID=1033252 RepID=A0AAD7JPX7_9AGAR|nr:hypothetical protein B0H16DRAFT_1778977 [Mycena metata]
MNFQAIPPKFRQPFIESSLSLPSSNPHPASTIGHSFGVRTNIFIFDWRRGGHGNVCVRRFWSSGRQRERPSRRRASSPARAPLACFGTQQDWPRGAIREGLVMRGGDGCGSDGGARRDGVGADGSAQGESVSHAAPVPRVAADRSRDSPRGAGMGMDVGDGSRDGWREYEFTGSAGAGRDEDGQGMQEADGRGTSGNVRSTSGASANGQVSTRATLLLVTAAGRRWAIYTERGSYVGASAGTDSPHGLGTAARETWARKPMAECVKGGADIGVDFQAFVRVLQTDAVRGQCADDTLTSATSAVNPQQKLVCRLSAFWRRILTLESFPASGCPSLKRRDNVSSFGLVAEIDTEILRLKAEREPLKTRYPTSSGSYRRQSKAILVPLTNSLYLPGKLSDLDHVIVDVGTGYFVQKVGSVLFTWTLQPTCYQTRNQAHKHYAAKVKYIQGNLDTLEDTIGKKKDNMGYLVNVMQAKLVQQQQGAMHFLSR